MNIPVSCPDSFNSKIESECWVLAQNKTKQFVLRNCFRQTILPVSLEVHDYFDDDECNCKVTVVQKFATLHGAKLAAQDLIHLDNYGALV